MAGRFRATFAPLLACAVSFGLVEAARCQTPATIQNLQQRLERLEKQNEELLRALKTVEADPPALLGFSLTPPEEKPASGSREDAQPIAQDLVAAEEAKKKTELPAPSREFVIGQNLGMTARWNNGLFLETAGGDFKVKLGGRLHQEWVWVGDTDDRIRADPGIGNFHDAVFFRRARLRAEGDAWEVVSWVAEYEFAASDEVRFREIFMDINKIPLIGTFRVGEIVEPIGFDTLSSDRYIMIPERSPLHNTFFPEYNPGMMIFNQALDQRITWQLAVARDDGGADIGRVLGDGTYNYDARVSVLPWYEDEGRQVVHLATAYHHRNAQIGVPGTPRTLRLAIPPSFRQGRTTPNLVDTGAIVCDGLDEIAGELFVNYGPFSLQSEAVLAGMNNARVGGASNDAFFWGAYVELGLFLTGENMNFDKRFGRIDRIKKINEPYFFVRTTDDGGRRLALGRGAWQLVGRYSFIDLTDRRAGIFGGAMHDIVGGLNWYLNPNFKVMLNYIVATRAQGAPVAAGAGSGRGSVNAGMLFFAWDF